MPPLVTVICLVYNHQKYIKQALESVYFQTYPNLEIIIVDDASQDQSLQIIEAFLQDLPHYQAVYAQNTADIPFRDIQLIRHQTNTGNCVAFNEAFRLSKGKYIIDFATDDILLDERISRQVAIFEQLSSDYGVVFSNALEIDAKGNVLQYHYAVDARQKARIKVPQGDIYQNLLEKYFISTPTMLIRREVLEYLGAYDESLSYEDFDFWVRSARQFYYYYQDEVTTCKRILPDSHSQQFYRLKSNPHLQSTLQVCCKALKLNRTAREHQALAKCVKYYLRQSFYTHNFELVADYQVLLQKIPQVEFDFATRAVIFLAKCRLPTFGLYTFYRNWAKWFRM
ncbi:MAG: glycosyltransferase [Microscillaceae bacterium]|nr:glycosyltransferase [Microscillaceae bacterium]